MSTLYNLEQADGCQFSDRLTLGLARESGACDDQVAHHDRVLMWFLGPPPPEDAKGDYQLVPARNGRCGPISPNHWAEVKRAADPRPLALPRRFRRLNRRHGLGRQRQF
jgi:hypothetical protein